MAKKPVTYKPGLTAAIEAAKNQVHRPLFQPSIRRSIPMRHQALGALFSGPQKPGLPTGCFIEIIGQPHAGKTSLTFALIDAVINQPDDPVHRIQTEKGIEWVVPPKRVLYLDYEHALDLEYLRKSGRNVRVLETDDDGTPRNLDTANVFVHQPMTLEEGCDLQLHMIASREFGLIINDSIAVMLSKEEADKSMSEMTVGKQARAVGAFLRKSAPMVSKHQCTVVLINQWRDKIGVAFGDPRTTPGGKAPAFYDSIRCDVSGSHRTPWFADGKLVRVKTLKNKITGSKGEVVYHLETGHGISAEVELTEMALVAGVIKYHSHKRPVTLQLKANRTKSYPNMAAWIDALRTNERLFDAVLRQCHKRGILSAKSVAGDSGWAQD